MASQRFEALVQQEGPGVFIELPAQLVAGLGSRKRPPVLVTINTHTYRSTPAVYGGRHYLPLRREVRSAAGISPGDVIEVQVEPDETPRTVEIPADLAEALGRDSVATIAFERLSYTHRREYVTWVESAKRDQTRMRRLAQALDMLREGRPTPL